MVEGAPPFGNEDNYIATLHRAALGKINPITRAGALSPILLKLLEPSPANRPTMANARDQLAQFAADTLGTTDNVLTGLVTTKPLHNRRAVAVPPVTPTPQTPRPEPHASDARSHDSCVDALAPKSAPQHRPTQVAASDYYAPRTTPQPLVYQQSAPSHPAPGHYAPQPPHPSRQQQSGTNAGLAAAVFAVFVLLTAIAAGVIILAL